MNKIALMFILLLIIMLGYHSCYVRTVIPKTKIKPPVIQICDNFISKETCDNIINSYNSYVSSKVNNGNIAQESIGRTSSTIYFNPGDSKLIDSIKNHVATKLHLNPSLLEPGQLTKYEKGEYYGKHYDFFKNNIKTQREYTVLIYLNTLNVNDGGETRFKFGKTFRPVQGQALCWKNVDNFGKGLINTLHESKPMLSNNTKYILTFWSKVSK